MAKLDYEKTNRKVKVFSRSYLSNKWKPLINKYPTQCYVCNKYIGNGVKILWHSDKKYIIHESDCSI